MARGHWFHQTRDKLDFKANLIVSFEMELLAAYRRDPMLTEVSLSAKGSSEYNASGHKHLPALDAVRAADGNNRSIARLAVLDWARTLARLSQGCTFFIWSWIKRLPVLQLVVRAVKWEACSISRLAEMAAMISDVWEQCFVDLQQYYPRCFLL